MPTAAGKQEKAVTPAISNSKDDSNSVTAHNSRNESNNRTANTVGPLANVGILEKVVNQVQERAFRKANYSRNRINMGTSWMWKVVNSTVERTAIFSRDTSNSSRSSQLDY